jgi:pseudaminic acid cytidylyltransferase
MTICIIPARAGSKRIPGKNTATFIDTPILNIVIHSAKKSGLFDDIIVTTDDTKAIDIARDNDIPYILRPEHLCDDNTSTKTVIAHAIEEVGCQHLEPVCCLYPTAVFTKPQHLIDSHKMLLSSNDAAFIMAAVEYAHPIERSLHLMKDNHVMPRSPAAMSQRTQDLTKSYHDAGQLYWAAAHIWLSETPIISVHTKAYIMPKHTIDIDEPADWNAAEALLSTW